MKKRYQNSIFMKKGLVLCGKDKNSGEKTGEETS